MTNTRPTRYRDSFAAVRDGRPHRFDQAEGHDDVVASRANDLCRHLAHLGASAPTVTLEPETDDYAASAVFESADGWLFLHADDTLAIAADGTATQGLTLEAAADWLHRANLDEPAALSRYALIDETGTTPRDIATIPDLEQLAPTDTNLAGIIERAQPFADALIDAPDSIRPTFSYDGRLGAITHDNELLALITAKAVVAVRSSWSDVDEVLDDPDAVTRFAAERVMVTFD